MPMIHIPHPDLFEDQEMYKQYCNIMGTVTTYNAAFLSNYNFIIDKPLHYKVVRGLYDDKDYRFSHHLELFPDIKEYTAELTITFEGDKMYLTLEGKLMSDSLFELESATPLINEKFKTDLLSALPKSKISESWLEESGLYKFVIEFAADRKEVSEDKDLTHYPITDYNF